MILNQLLLVAYIQATTAEPDGSQGSPVASRTGGGFLLSLVARGSGPDLPRGSTRRQNGGVWRPLDPPIGVFNSTRAERRSKSPVLVSPHVLPPRLPPQMGRRAQRYTNRYPRPERVRPRGKMCDFDDYMLSVRPHGLLAAKKSDHIDRTGAPGRRRVAMGSQRPV